MSLVYRNENPLFVHSAKNILDINGIDSFLKNEHGSTMGPEFGSSNLLELWVSNSDDCMNVDRKHCARMTMSLCFE